MYAASFNPRPRQTAMRAVIRSFGSWGNQLGPKGMPTEIDRSTVGRLNQKMSCTSTGVPRKNQMYSHATPETMGFLDRRMMARITPRTTPMSMAMTVSLMVLATPVRMGLLNRYWRTTSQCRAVSVTSQCTNWAANTRMTIAATHRPRWRTGMATMAPPPDPSPGAGAPGDAEEGPDSATTG